MTLARMRGGRQQAVARFLAENGGLHTQPFTATRFVLLSARPGSGGGPYVVEAEFPVRGRRPGSTMRASSPTIRTRSSKVRAATSQHGRYFLWVLNGAR